MMLGKARLGVLWPWRFHPHGLMSAEYLCWCFPSVSTKFRSNFWVVFFNTSKLSALKLVHKYAIKTWVIEEFLAKFYKIWCQLSFKGNIKIFQFCRKCAHKQSFFVPRAVYSITCEVNIQLGASNKPIFKPVFRRNAIAFRTIGIG